MDRPSVGLQSSKFSLLHVGPSSASLANVLLPWFQHRLLLSLTQNSDTPVSRRTPRQDGEVGADFLWREGLLYFGSVCHMFVGDLGILGGICGSEGGVGDIGIGPY